MVQNHRYFGYNLDFNPGIGFSKNFETHRFSHFSLSKSSQEVSYIIIDIYHSVDGNHGEGHVAHTGK